MCSISDKPDPVVLRITVEDVVEAFGKGYGISRPCHSTTSASEQCMRSVVL